MTPPTYEQLQNEVQTLRQLVEQLQTEVLDLRARLDASQRVGRRQAAPFSKGAPTPEPKSPGRKAGDAHGRHAHRPTPTHVDETHDAPLPAGCPDCGRQVVETHIDHEYQTDIPRRPIVRQFDVHCGCCQQCGSRCRGRHPLQTSSRVLCGAATAEVGR